MEKQRVTRGQGADRAGHLIGRGRLLGLLDPVAVESGGVAYEASALVAQGEGPPVARGAAEATCVSGPLEAVVMTASPYSGF
jgi:hypothetical protein